MPKKYTKAQKREIFNRIIDEIADNGRIVRDILKEDWSPSTSTFFLWLDEDEVKSKQYARACEIRADMLFEEMMHIAFNPEEGETIKMSQKGEGKKALKEMEKTKGDMLGHRKLKIDTIKWALSKMEPKKYGTKLDLTSNNEKIESPKLVVEVKNSGAQIANTESDVDLSR